MNRYCGCLSAALAVALCAASCFAASPPAARAVADLIDREIDTKLKDEKVASSPAASDAEFLRRVCLDIAGVIPTAERAKAFLDSTDPDRRAKLIDELLATGDYGKRMADTWQDLLLTRNGDNRRLHGGAFYQWLVDSFNENKPWDKMTRELLTASGPQDKNGPVAYFLANGTVDKITDNVTKNLLGMQLQCAQCHNHPFTGWKQEEYWGMAAFFLKVRADLPKGAAKGAVPTVSEGMQINRNKRTLPESAKLVPARFLQGERPRLAEREPYRPVLADWITSSKNPYFAKAMVNRVWSIYFGRGLVNPVDDMQEGNAPSHPALFDKLAQGFADGFDVKQLIRGICNSHAYQRTSKPIKGNEEAEPHLLSRMNVKVLSAEMLFDSLVQVSGSPGGQGQPAHGARESFVIFFRADEGSDGMEYNHGIPQALRLMNSSQFSRTALLDRLTKNSSKPEEVIEQLYLTTLSRRPTSGEMTRMLVHLKKGQARQGYNDVLWALVNCSEFALNR